MKTDYAMKTDNELMVMAKTGDKFAFEGLVNRYKKKAYYLALKLVGVCFLLLAAWVGWEGGGALLRREEPGESWVGILLAALSLIVMVALGGNGRDLTGLLTGSALSAAAGLLVVEGQTVSALGLRCCRSVSQHEVEAIEDPAGQIRLRCLARGPYGGQDAPALGGDLHVGLPGQALREFLLAASRPG